MGIHCCWITASGVSGVSVQAETIANALDDEIEVTLVHAHPIETGHESTYIEDENGTVYPVESLSEAVNNLAPDVVMFHETGTECFNAFPRIKGNAVTMARLGINLREQLMSGPARAQRMEQFASLWHQTDHLVASSPRVANELRAIGIGKDRITHIPTAIDPDEYKEPERETNDAVGMIGRIGLVKNQMTVLEGMAAFRDMNRDLDPEVHIAGNPNDSTWQGVQHFIETITPNYAIEMYGEIEDPDEDFYPNIDVHAHPSLTENSPQNILEAAVHGIPTVTSDLEWAEAYPEMELPRVHPDDPWGWAEELDKMLKNTAYRREQARKQQQAVKENYTVEQIVPHYVDLFESAVDRLSAFKTPRGVRVGEGQ